MNNTSSYTYWFHTGVRFGAEQYEFEQTIMVLDVFWFMSKQVHKCPNRIQKCPKMPINFKMLSKNAWKSQRMSHDVQKSPKMSKKGGTLKVTKF